jgi:anti-anti-sigma factor
MLEALVEQPRKVVLDLSRLRFCDVPGMRVLVDFSQTAAEHGVDVEIRGASGQVGRLMDLTRTRGVLPLGL